MRRPTFIDKRRAVGPDNPLPPQHDIGATIMNEEHRTIDKQEQQAARVARRVYCLCKPRLTRLSGGCQNNVWKVESRNGVMVLRCSQPPSAHPWRRRLRNLASMEWEMKLMTKLSSMGVSRRGTDPYKGWNTCLRRP